jgi:hypothetical protein
VTLSKLIVVIVGVVLLAACSDPSSIPTSPGMPETSLSVRDAKVVVGGVAVQGPVNMGTDEPARFEVRVTSPQGLSAVGRVVMQYNQPGQNHHGGAMMGGYNGTTLCYDDGTHGDIMGGDGVYSYMDEDDMIGCHGINAPNGQYMYGFWAEDVNGQRSNTATVTVTRE